jgi:uncharacterized protein (DUF1330 family)
LPSELLGDAREDTMKAVQRIAITATSGVLVGALGATLLHAQASKAPPGYVVVEFTVKEPDAFKDYSQRAPATISQHGGKFVVRGGKVAGLKGDVPKGPFIILAFESAEQAQKWASSPEYSALVPLRDNSAETRAFVVEGVAP